MAAVVFCFGVFNLGVGAVLALLLERRLTLKVPFVFTRLVQHATFQSSAAAWASGVTTSRRVTSSDEAFGVLAEANPVEARSMLESVLWIVRNELPRYRRRLMDIGAALREDEDASLTAAQVESPVQDWLAMLDVLTTQLTAHEDEPLHPERYHDVAEELLDHTCQIQDRSDTVIRGIDDRTTSRENTFQHLAGLLQPIDRLRAFVDNQLGSLARAEGRVAELPDELRCDEASGTVSRLGLESLFEEWKDASRAGTLSCVLLDVDRVSRLNPIFGAAVVDGALGRFGQLLTTMVRKDRGFDRVVRLRGTSFLLFLGEAEVGEAASTAERIRQTVEAVSFHLPGESFELTVSCGVAEWQPDESLDDHLARLWEAVAAAKDAGRNRTGLHDGAEVKVLEIQSYRVEGRTVDCR